MLQEKEDEILKLREKNRELRKENILLECEKEGLKENATDGAKKNKAEETNKIC